MHRTLQSLAIAALGAALALSACGSDDEDDGASGPNTGSPEQTGSTCESPNECYPDVAEGQLLGEALCLAEVRGGYCTHTCSADEDCCAAEGECETDLHQVCSPFQATGQMMCFLSCEAGDIPDGLDEQQYCQREASRDFICRSSGGGAQNRKICVPGDCGVGAACGESADCSGDLECVLGFDGGYCTRSGCTSDAECPGDSRCVQWDEDESYCLAPCGTESDCSFCRGDDLTGSCASDVEFVEAEPVSVCIPRR